MTVAAPNGPLSKAPVAPGTLASTEHALLVPLGHFAGQIGLLAALQRVPFPMKTVDHRPGDKLAELLAHILAGGMHVTELAASAHPLVDDRVGAQAWGRRRGGAGVGAQAWGRRRGGRRRSPRPRA